MKRIICILLSLVLAFLLSSCKSSGAKEPSADKDNIQSAAKAGTLRLLYSASDSFNPYTAETDLNRKLSLLLFDPLVKLDNSYQPEYILAESVETQNAVCTVRLKNAYFTDGSAVTADDVVYSYNLAKSSVTDYSYQLYEVVSVSAADSKTVVFRLSRNDPFFERLIDFPIIKSGSDKTTDIDGRVLTPIGSGRYTVNAEGNGLVSNKNYIGSKINIDTISLINAPDSEAVSHYVEIGATDIYYNDVADMSIVRMSGKKSTVNLNNMIYIGINHSYGQLSSAALRHAISSAIDRTEICKEAYHNNAVAATGFYNPSIKLLQSVQNLQTAANPQISIENLEEIGYNNLDSEGIRVNSSGNRINLTLMVNSENAARVRAARLIAERLLAVGIKVTVIERNYQQYTEALSSGNFQLYIGEIKTLANMDLSALTVGGGSCAFGIPSSTPSAPNQTVDAENPAPSVATVINGYFSGINTITDVAVTLQTELPVIPVCFRQGLLFHSADIGNVGEASQSDIYYSIGQYTVV